MTAAPLSARQAQALVATIASVLYLGVVLAVFDPPVELLSTGVANGALYGLTAVGIILVYRTNRIINFAAAGLGAVPGVLGCPAGVEPGLAVLRRSRRRPGG